MAHQGSNITFDNGIAVNFATGQVTRQGKELNLSPVNTRLLQILVGAKGSLVLRQQLFDEVWPNQIISDDALTRAIADIRAIFKQLTDDKVIETLPKRGYRWLITPVRTSCMDAQANESENKGTDRKLFSNSGFLDESKS